MMTTQFHAKSMVVLAMMLCGQITPGLVAQNSVPAPAAASQPAPVQLSVDVWDVLRMAHGNVSDATMIAYVKNSGKVYSLGASEIVYLRQQGVSDAVVTAMLEQPRNVATTTATPAVAQPTRVAQPLVWANSDNNTYGTPPVVAAPAQAATTYVQAAPVYAQPAPVYTYPPSYGYYDYWPYYGSYWGYPAVSFSFGWGGRYGGYRGWGYHGGGHFGGGYHGGGGHR